MKSNKNDARDAEAICEAVSRSNMRYVPVKALAQQAVLSLHRARQGFVVERTAQGNQIRGLLSEFGIVIPKGIRYLEHRLPEILEDAESRLYEPRSFQTALQPLSGVGPAGKRAGAINAICKRVIGMIRRECLDWLIRLSEAHLRTTLASWVQHHNEGAHTRR